ncbi:MAG TPA: biopolymer transporter ExbD [Chthoniobacteraceae bacterium]|jgi:biopolymer transport protein ExbD|nr:biopolymer transporter ExbD [Chthoniobacteraceae bacterium]
MAGSVGSEDGDVGFQIAPMVDVVFVLMLFFMASAGVQIVEKELSMNLPSGAGRPSDVPTTPIVVDIGDNGNVTVNDQAFGNKDDKGLNQLKAFFKKNIAQFGDKDPVIVRPSPDTTHERVMDVLNAAAAAKVSKLTFSG